jgi:hypothetical protein
VVAAVALFRAIRHRPAVARVGLTLRAAGLTTAAVVLVVAAAVRLLAADSTDSAAVHPAGHGVAVTITGLGLGLAVLLLGAGLLWAPMVVAPRSRFPQVLDGTLMMICLLAFVWAIFLESWHDRLVDGQVPFRLVADCLVLAVPVVVAGTVIGTSVVTAANRPRLTRPALVVCAGTGLFSVGLLGLMIGSTGRAAPWVLQGSTLTVSAGAVALMAAVHIPARHERVPPARETRPCWV